MSISVHVEVQPDPQHPETTQLRQEPIQAFLYDLSEYGIGLLSNVSIPWGIVVHLDLPRSALPLANPLQGLMQITGRVIHSLPHAGRYRLGISFTRMEESDRLLIRRLLQPAAPTPPAQDRRRTPRLLMEEESP